MKEPFIGYILFQHDLYIHLTVLITGQFVSKLFIMFCEAFDLLLPFTPQSSTDRTSRNGQCRDETPDSGLYCSEA